jgi:hypothetical protein
MEESVTSNDANRSQLKQFQIPNILPTEVSELYHVWLRIAVCTPSLVVEIDKLMHGTIHILHILTLITFYALSYMDYDAKHMLD